MRTLLTIIPLALAISACSLYLDDKKTPRMNGPTAPDANPFYPDAHVISNDAGGSGCHGSNDYPDAGIWGDDGGISLDAGTYGYPDAALH
ncbi:MAG TPA: hypothetical protein VF403_03800 [Kofleriaceae bacterium]